MKFEIKNRWSLDVQFACEIEAKETDSEAVKLGMAIKVAYSKSANLDGANLYGANLYGANLDGANLDGANLRSANLYGANLRSANLYGANLDGANLRSANLDGANLDSANLRSANLYGANLDGANLYGANLDGANLDGANLYGAKVGELKLIGKSPIMQFGPIGNSKRYGLALYLETGIEVRLGCFRGTEKEAIAAVKEKYGAKTSYAKVISASCSWLKEQAK